MNNRQSKIFSYPSVEVLNWNLVVWSWPIRKKRREKEADSPWFTQKANKAPVQGLLCSWRPQAPSRWGEGTEHLLERVLEARARKWTQRASALQINLKTKREREGKNDTRRPSFGEQGLQLFFQKELLYLKLYIENNGRCRAMQGQQSRPSRDQAFFLHTFPFTKVLGDLHIFWPGGLITFYDSFFW